MQKKEESFGQFISWLVHDIFFTSFFIYAVSFFSESLMKGIVVNHVNLKIVLMICIASGLYSAAFPPRFVRLRFGYWHMLFALCISIAAGCYAYQTASDIWQWRLLFSVAVGMALMSVLSVLSGVSSDESPSS